MKNKEVLEITDKGSYLELKTKGEDGKELNERIYDAALRSKVVQKGRYELFYAKNDNDKYYHITDAKLVVNGSNVQTSAQTNSYKFSTQDPRGMAACSAINAVKDIVVKAIETGQLGPIVAQDEEGVTTETPATTRTIAFSTDLLNSLLSSVDAFFGVEVKATNDDGNTKN